MNRRTILKATAISGVAALLVSMSPPTALATFPGANGRIVFSRVDENGLHQLWTANPDLSAAHQLKPREREQRLARVGSRRIPDRLRQRPRRPRPDRRRLRQRRVHHAPRRQRRQEAHRLRRVQR